MTASMNGGKKTMSEEIIKQANEEMSVAEEPPQPLSDFLGTVQENPSTAAHSVKYILEAIESCGTRTVVEGGEEQERHKFFDDPYGNGEHAILGNTEVLNSFVDELRRMASSEGENNKIIWFNGPTATGKSELKRCLINGLRGYSRTEEGQVYSVEWNIKSAESTRGVTYGSEMESADWYDSPIGVNPLAVLPKDTRESFLEDVNEGEEYPVSVEGEIDPFSQEVFNYLKRQYSDEGTEDLFEKITDENHLRVVRRQFGLGDGIGVLHSEDGGTEKQRLVGSWMQGMLNEFQSRGRKNPQAFAYDGVLSQGNGGMTIIEDARQHIDAIQKLLNIPEESVVKLDQKIPMDIDTLLVLISNPDLASELEQFSDEGSSDPLRALRRRLDEFEVGYLTSFTLEAQLIRRILLNETEVWDCPFDEREERTAEPIELYDCDFSPRAVEAAAMYDVLSRISISRVGILERYEKALAVDRGYHVTSTGDKVEYDKIDDGGDRDGGEGIPVTYTIDVLTELAQNEDEVIPEDVIEIMADSFSESPVISGDEDDFYTKRRTEVREYIRDRQEEDVLSAMLKGKEARENEIENYVNGVFAWDEGDDEGDEYDPYKLREFELEYLGAADEQYSDDAKPDEDVEKYRVQKIINPINSFIYENKDDDFSVSEVALTECEDLSRLLGRQTWGDVQHYYEDIDLSSWSNPVSGTVTEEVKEKTIQNMMDDMGYSETSAERVSYKIIEYATLDDSSESLTLRDMLDKMEGEEDGS